MGDVPSANPILSILKEIWVGKYSAREFSVRVGTVDVMADKDGLHINFSSRFTLNEKDLAKLKKKVKDFELESDREFQRLLQTRQGVKE